MAVIERRNPHGMPPTASVREWHELCIYLGGSDDSWTGLLLRLIQKSDSMHKAVLRQTFPLTVAAFEAWRDAKTEALTVATLEATMRPLPTPEPTHYDPTRFGPDAPPPLEDGSAVLDRNGVVWTVTRDGGMFTRADYAGPHSCGVVWLHNTAGPLRILHRAQR